MKAFLTLNHGANSLGTLHLDLYEQDVPKTVHNFCELLRQRYRGSIFHRIIPGFMAQGGDYTKGDGTGGRSAYKNQYFADENFVHSHVGAGILSMANAGPNTNGSQFFVCFRELPHLNGKHVVFGRVDLTKSADVLEALELIRTGKDDRPKQPVTIVGCGVMGDKKETQKDEEGDPAEDEDEIELEGEEGNHQNPAEDLFAEDVDESPPKDKAEALRRRMRKIKQKMNQARQLNKQAVKEEGESISGVSKRKAKKRHENEVNEAMTEQAADAVEAARLRADRDELNKYQPNDYHNPEGQYRNYEKNVRTFEYQNDGAAVPNTGTYNPLDHTEEKPGQQREAAHKVAVEMKRRIEKSAKREAKKRKNADDSLGINKRNQRFVEKINRTYDKQTREIRENLERGTAL